MQRADARRDAAERELLSQQQGNLRSGQVSPNTAAAMAQAGNSPDTGEPYTEEEWELRERLRLEARDREGQTYRQSERRSGRSACSDPRRRSRSTVERHEYHRGRHRESRR